MTSVFLVDDHEVVRGGVAHLIDSHDDLDVVGEAGTAAQALVRIAATLPDVAVLDVRLPDSSGIDLCRDIRSAHPGIQCLMLTAFDDDQASVAAVLAGAAGYVLKDIRGDRLIDSIRTVARGGSLVDPQMSRRVVASITDGPRAPDVALTKREHDVLELIAEGMTNRQIGEVLGLAEKTVKNYVSGLLRSLGMERRTQAAVYGASLRKP
ncbi:response regulator transcription factor [Frigoribacterium sp. MCBA15_019]|uniref:response regulator n=1 Tax=unclassified Frigoribacterium TaxID=2627005 RepID=UPI0009F30D94|nr:response regulator transcription factor [Frigoribacterium sp. MCBA15_019]